MTAWDPKTAKWVLLLGYNLVPEVFILRPIKSSPLHKRYPKSCREGLSIRHRSMRWTDISQQNAASQ